MNHLSLPPNTRLPDVRRWLRRRAIILLAILLGIVALSFGLAVPVGKALKSQVTLNYGFSLPDGDLYLFHSSLATVLGIVRASPSTTAVQWVKAASHARSLGQIAQAGRGIAAERTRATGSILDRDLCNVYNYGTPSIQSAITRAGLNCRDDSLSRSHLPEGSPITYDQNPPIGGPHYPSPYPSYGLIDHAVPPGFWVHNLEHGAIVLLYNCPDGCLDLLGQVNALYLTLPPGHNDINGHARLLVTPYAGMGQQLAVIAWGHELKLNQFDRDQIVTFYREYVDRGPECWNLTCPG